MLDKFHTLTAPFDSQNTAYAGLLYHWDIFKIMHWISECNLLPSDVTNWGEEFFRLQLGIISLIVEACSKDIIYYLERVYRDPASRLTTRRRLLLNFAAAQPVVWLSERR